MSAKAASVVSLRQQVSAFLIQATGGDEIAARRLYLTAFAEDPAGDYDRDTRARMWAGAPADTYLKWSLGGNFYMAVSTFRPDETGKVRRRQATLDRGWFVMIDDVGDGPSAKVLPQFVALDPTWAVETSPGNCQLWYRLDPPVADGALLNRVVDALIQQGLATDHDPGMKGCTRYGRLPFGVNNKAKYCADYPGGFPVRLVPEMTDFSRSYSLEQFAAAWGIERALAAPPDVAPAIPLGGASGVPELNAAVMGRLVELGCSPTPKPGTAGIYVLAACPFADKHGVGAGGDGAAVFLVGARDGSEVYQRGAFRCHHGHGETDRWPQLLDRLGLMSEFKQIEATAEFDPVDIGELKAESVAIGEGDPGLPRDAVARYNIVSLEDMLARFAFTEHVGYVVDVARPKLTMSLATFKAATSALVLPHPVTGDPMPMSKAWLESPQRKTVVTTTFYPGQPEFCWAVEEGAGYDAVNIWRPVAHVAPPGWQSRVAPFLDHLAYLVPVDAERERLLDWLAHVEQKPADRPHSHYLMVATTQGIGRSYLGSALARVWPGYTALNFDLVRMLNSGFSGRLSAKLFAVVDEIAEGGKGGDRWAHAETMKSLLSSETIEINVKYGAQRVERNCLRFLMFSNHLSAIPLDATDRRWHVIRNPSVAKSPAYYTELYGRLRDPDYIAALREMLRRRDLARYNPHALPLLNAAKSELIEAGLSAAEQRYVELVEEHPTDVIDGGTLMLEMFGPTNDHRQHTSHFNQILERHGGVKLGRVRIGEGKPRQRLYALRNAEKWRTRLPVDWLAEWRGG